MTEVQSNVASARVERNNGDLTWRTVDGVQIIARTWSAVDPSAQVLIVHGLGDHGGRFAHVAKSLVEHGYRVTAPDLRGHGRSGGQRGYVPRFDTLLNDLHQSIDVLQRDHLPLFLYGQSLGGMLSLYFAMRCSSTIRGVIASSPALAISMHRPAWKLLVGRLAAMFPRLSLSSGLDIRHLTDDDRKLDQIADDPLRHDRVTARTYFGMVRAGKWCQQNAARMVLPSLILHSPGDPITDFQASEQFAQRCGPQCTFKSIESGKHELHNLKSQKLAIGEVVNWLKPDCSVST